MKKIILAVGFLIGAGAVVYATGLYTYFIRTDVQEDLVATIPAAEKQPVETESVPQPQTIRTGSFQPIDVIHKGSGTAKVVQVGNSTVLRLENFSVTSGPDLYVYLTKTEKPTGDVESLDDYIDLGRLKGTSGNQTYTISTDATDYHTAVVWCKKYGVLFSYAVMQ